MIQDSIILHLLIILLLQLAEFSVIAFSVHKDSRIISLAGMMFIMQVELACMRGHEYGVQMADGPMRGLLSRAVIVVDPEGKIVYEKQVPS